MARRLQFRRVLLLALLLGAAFAGLGYRLVDLQVWQHEELSNEAQQNTLRKFYCEPRRGDILDAKGNLLATSIFVKTICADPVLIGNRQAEVTRVIAPLLQISEGELYQRLLPRTKRNETGQNGHEPLCRSQTQSEERNLGTDSNRNGQAFVRYG